MGEGRGADFFSLYLASVSPCLTVQYAVRFTCEGIEVDFTINNPLFLFVEIPL